jgi:hypothetical protein
LREGTRKADLNIENENDYALGYAHGMITASFHATFMMLTNRLPNAEEKAEADTIIYNRTDELRNSILKSGQQVIQFLTLALQEDVCLNLLPN